MPSRKAHTHTPCTYHYIAINLYSYDDCRRTRCFPNANGMPIVTQYFHYLHVIRAINGDTCGRGDAMAAAINSFVFKH